MGIRYWKGGMAGAEGSFTDVLVADTIDVDPVEDLGGSPNRVRFHAAAHSFALHDYIVISGTTNYDGEYRIEAVATDTFDVESVYTSETPGGTEVVSGCNWHDENDVPAAVPVAADRIIFDSSARVATDVSPRHTEGNHWNLIDDIAVGDTGALELADILIDTGFTGDIGIDAQQTVSAFHVSVADGGAVTFKSNGKAYIECSEADAVSDINIPMLVHDSASGYLEISSDVNSASWTSTWDEVRVLNQGTLVIADGTWVAILRTYTCQAKIIIGTGCVEVKDSNDEMDLYLGSSGVYAATRPTVEVEIDGLMNFGANALTITCSA